MITVLFRYDVVVAAIPEICTFGETFEEARVMAEDAIRCNIESATKLIEEILDEVTIDREPVKEYLSVTLAA